MLYDILYSTFVLGGLMTAFDILGKVNKKEIKDLNDLKIDLAKKGLYVLRVYSNTAIVVGSFVDSIYNCLDSRKYAEEENLNKLKLDVFSVENDLIKKGVILYSYEDSESEMEEDETDSEPETDEDESSQDESSEDESKNEEKEDSNEESLNSYDNIKKTTLLMYDTDTKDSLISVYDYYTKTYLTLNELDLKQENQIENVKMILKRIDSSMYDKRLFLNIELINGEEKHDLNKYVSAFYRTGNNILSKDFLEYIIADNELNIELVDDYSLNIMDKNINLVTLNKDKHISIIETSEENSLPTISYEIN